VCVRLRLGGTKSLDQARRGIARLLSRSRQSRAHPSRPVAALGAPRLRAHTIYLPELGDTERNRQMDALLSEFIQKLTQLLTRP